MTTPTTPDTADTLEELASVTAYRDWQAQEGLPVITGFYVPDLATLDLAPWPRKGGRGAFVNLEGTGGVNDLQVLEVPPGGALHPDRHLFEALVYVLAGRGSTTVWTDPAHKQSFEWGTGSLFAIPLNTAYQLFNGSGRQPARLACVTNAPTIMNLFHNQEFIFANPFIFRDRFSGEDGYFSGEGTMYHQAHKRRAWLTNFVADVRAIELYEWKARGAGGRNVVVELAHNSMGAHISQFPVGTYKKAHRHGPGAHVIILDGTGYSLLWPQGREAEEPLRVDWQANSVVVPPENWFHQHFNTGTRPTRYLALKYAGRRFRLVDKPGADWTDVSVKQGGLQMEYEDEAPSVHALFEAELARHGAACRMRGLVPGCTATEDAE